MERSDRPRAWLAGRYVRAAGDARHLYWASQGLQMSFHRARAPFANSEDCIEP